MHFDQCSPHPSNPPMSTLSTYLPLYTKWTFNFLLYFSHPSPVCVAQLLLEHDWPTRPLMKTDFACPRSCQMLIAPVVMGGVQAPPISPSPHWDFVWLELEQILCNYPVVCKTHHFLGVIYHLWCLQSFCLLLPEDPWAVWGGMYRFHSGLNTLHSFILCTLTSQRSLC